MLLRDKLILELAAKGLSMASISKELQVKRAIVVKRLKVLERQGHVYINRTERPYTLKVLEVTPKNGGYIKRGNLWGLRNFAVKFQFKGPEPTSWRPFKKGWRGGPAYSNYIRGVRVEAYVGTRGARTLVVYAPSDMQGEHPKVLEHEAIAWCKRLASYLEPKLGWQVTAQLDILGSVIPIKKGEYEYRPLKQYAKTLRDQGLTPIFTQHGKIDKSPKPAAFQVYTAGYAEKLLEAPATIEHISEKLEAQLAKQTLALDKVTKVLTVIGKRLDNIEVK